MIKNILTIDVEDMCHSRFDADLRDDVGIDEALIRDSVDMLLDMLDKYDYKATFFVLGIIAEKMPEVIRKISGKKHEIASHGYRHRSVYSLSPEEFRDDLLRSIKVLEDISASRVLGYRAPYWSITDKSLWAMDIIKECGLLYDSSISPAITFLYGIKKVRRDIHIFKNGLWEIPPTTINILGKVVIIGGGFYLRTFPYWFTKNCIRRLNNRAVPAIIYLHPHEVLNSPYNEKLSYKENLVLNFNKKTFCLKFMNLLSEFKFSTIKEIIGL